MSDSPDTSPAPAPDRDWLVLLSPTEVVGPISGTDLRSWIESGQVPASARLFRFEPTGLNSDGGTSSGEEAIRLGEALRNAESRAMQLNADLQAKDLALGEERQRSERLAAEARQQVAEAQRKVEEAQRNIDEACQQATEAQRQIETARQDAEEARNQANEAQGQIEAARQDAEEARKQADEAKRQAETARQDAETARTQADEAKRQAEEARQDATKARSQADEAARQAVESRSQADEATRQADEYRRKADALDAAFEAERERGRAISERLADAARVLSDLAADALREEGAASTDDVSAANATSPATPRQTPLVRAMPTLAVKAEVVEPVFMPPPAPVPASGAAPAPAVGHLATLEAQAREELARLRERGAPAPRWARRKP